MRMSRIVHLWAFDPGETTGWCHLSVNDNEIGIYNGGEANHFGIGNLLYDNQALKAAVSKIEIIETVFVVEKFIMQSKISQSPWSLETTGLIRYFAGHYNIALDDKQKPSEVKKLITNDVIQRAGLYVPGRGHQMDSVRHALYYLMVKRNLLTEFLKGTKE